MEHGAWGMEGAFWDSQGGQENKGLMNQTPTMNQAICCQESQESPKFLLTNRGILIIIIIMKKNKKKSLPGLMILLCLLNFTSASWCQSGFTQKDRELLIALKTRVHEIDKRFEQVDKRLAELREDMNKRLAELREDMNKRFEQVDKRFEQVDKRFEQIMSFVWILAAIFGAMTTATIGFALWDRKTMIRPFETKVSELENRITGNSKNYENLISFLKEYASKNKKFSETIQRFNLF